MRYTPFESMERLFEQMRRDMSGWHESAADWNEHGNEWSGSEFTADMTEHDDEYVLTVDMPGFERDEIDLRLDDSTLTVSAVHASDEGSVSRSRSVSERVTLPKEIVEADATASYRNGVLEVHLPIEPDAAERGHRIDVN